MTTRTDIHRPSAPEFNPEHYVCLGVFDLHPEEGDRRAHTRAVNSALITGASFAGAPHPSGQCGHCGAYLRYVALMEHRPTQTLMHVGQTCLDERFDLMTVADFRALRAAAAEAAKATRARNRRHEIADEVAGWLTDEGMDPTLIELTYVGNGGLVDTDDFLSSLAGYLHNHGYLTGPQHGHAVRAILRHIAAENRKAEQLAEQRQRQASATPAPTGRVTVRGHILRTWAREHDFGVTIKCRVVTETGWIAIGSVPAALLRTVDNRADLHGQRVQFTATVSPSDDDLTVGFYSRPTKPATY